MLKYFLRMSKWLLSLKLHEILQTDELSKL